MSQSCGALIRGREFAPSPTAGGQRPVVPLRAIIRLLVHPQTLLYLCAAGNNACIVPPPSNFLYIFTKTAPAPLFTTSRLAHPDPRRHSFTNRRASVFKLWPFRHCSGILESTKCWKSSFPPTPIRLEIPFLLSLRDSISPLGVSVSPAQNDHSSRRAARADLRISPRPVEATRHQPSTRVIAIIQRDEWQEEL